MPSDPEDKGGAGPEAQDPPSEPMTELDLVLPHQIAMKQLKHEEENAAKVRPDRELPPVKEKEAEVDEEVDDDRPTNLDLRTLRDGSDLVPSFSPEDFPEPRPPGGPAQGVVVTDEIYKPTEILRTSEILMPPKSTSKTWLVLGITALVIAAFCLGYLLGRTTG